MMWEPTTFRAPATGITVSTQQRDFTVKRLAESGVQNTEVWLQGYRAGEFGEIPTARGVFDVVA